MGSVQVFGVQGMLGSAVVRKLGCEVEGELDPFTVITIPPGQERPGMDLVDLGDGEALASNLDAVRPSCVINCAAITDVDACETSPGMAFLVNRDAVRNLARSCAALGARLIHVSTDFVFDGEKGEPYTEDDAPNPQSVYARSKYEGEVAVAEECENYAIVRTAWLYGRGKRNFVERVLEMAGNRERLMGVWDETGSPTYAEDVAGVLVKLARSDATGLYHCTNAGSCTRLEWIEEILRLAGIEKRVDPVPASTFKLPAARPSHSVLDCSKLKAAIGVEMRPWRKALAGYMESRGGTFKRSLDVK